MAPSDPKKPRDLLWIEISPTEQSRVILATSPSDATNQTLTQSTLTLLTTLFSSTSVHKDRFIYALAGCLFSSESPTPFGGSRTKPGFTTFHGETPSQLLHYIVREAYRVQWTIRQLKALILVTASVNRIMELHFGGFKDEIDELMLKGIKKAGHCEWFGVVRVPEYMKHVDEEGVIVQSVGFVMPSLAMQAGSVSIEHKSDVTIGIYGMSVVQERSTVEAEKTFASSLIAPIITHREDVEYNNIGKDIVNVQLKGLSPKERFMIPAETNTDRAYQSDLKPNE
ncbi:hypothetical protein BCR33DRAFT_500032 [Rhizoclosmatium globosum]|uniref:Uncharacterized protein n=1 Tax=Rhizoclosmatium globosum TaxID=329046 RepID=A0A1Y2CXC6_9FUNG|nr:hypothetical protein BCR33DRAFT_500032 [Rhizoclosmatium globosum]|eukprot:ORY50985.1 hypothetical protein BCR33DRAFT_500032 [Rhizoclosmatium globosum]